MSIRAGHESLKLHRRTGKDKFWGPYRQKQKTHKKGRFRMAKSDHLQGESNGSLQQQEHT
jgi:hypothetical protein